MRSAERVAIERTGKKRDADRPAAPRADAPVRVGASFCASGRCGEREQRNCMHEMVADTGFPDVERAMGEEVFLKCVRAKRAERDAGETQNSGKAPKIFHRTKMKFPRTERDKVSSVHSGRCSSSQTTAGKQTMSAAMGQAPGGGSRAADLGSSNLRSQISNFESQVWVLRQSQRLKTQTEPNQKTSMKTTLPVLFLTALAALAPAGAMHAQDNTNNPASSNATSASSSSMASGATSEPRSDYSITSDFTYTSKYVFRGVQQARASFQPSLEFATGGWNAGVWTNQPIKRH